MLQALIFCIIIKHIKQVRVLVSVLNNQIMEQLLNLDYKLNLMIH